jgi:antitoxin VapB
MEERQNILQKGLAMRSLNIKDPEAHRLAATLAKQKGESMTRVVTEALRESYERLQNRLGKAGVDELRAIARRASAKVKRPYLDHAKLLYDERGLPK